MTADETTSLCAYYQEDPRWADVVLGADMRPSLAHSGCGVFSFCNAVHALNGRLPDAVEIAQWAVSTGAYRPEGPGLYRQRFYESVEGAFGRSLRFTISGQHWGTAADDRLKDHLVAGGTAVVHVPNHFLALVGYDRAQDLFHVLESSCSLTRRLRRDSWVEAQRLEGGYTKVDWYVLLAAR